MNKKRYIWGVIFGLSTLFITLFIFWNSLQTGEESGKMSDVAVNIVKPVLEFFGITVKDHTLGVLVRKTAHFTEYFFLGTSFSLCLLNLINRRFIYFSPLYCLVVAVCDEFIMQMATSGRSPQWTDVLIDFGGGVFSLLILIFALYLTGRKRNRRKEQRL